MIGFATICRTTSSYIAFELLCVKFDITKSALTILSKWSHTHQICRIYVSKMVITTLQIHSKTYYPFYK